MYYKGDGVEKDSHEARKWWTLAAQQGYARAQYALGLMYAAGLDVSQDYVTAHKWWTLAAAQGDEDARKARDEVAQLMTPDQITEAQRLAREWQARHSQP
jgi:TPR repeat protein